jgi:signal transduction histidine kinase
MWLATRSDGIVLMDKAGKEIRSYTHADLNAGSDEGICDLYLDGDELWYGCLNGLGVLNIRTGEHIVYSNPVINQDGQSNNRTVFSILPDEDHGFYLGSSNGLLHFDRKKRIYSNLDENHPLAQNEYNRASAFIDSRGRYYFGTTDGLFSFLPDELAFSPAADTINPIKLYAISIFNGTEKQYRHLSADLHDLERLSLKPSDTNIEFSFSVPAFGKTVYYRYRIAGLDEQWSAFSPDNRILLYSLPPGDYSLEVRASTDVTDENASSYILRIHMPEVWYRKAWVIILLSLLFTGIVVALIRYRYQQKWLRQKELEKLRVSISSDLHDDVGSLLSGVAMQSQVMSFDVDEKHKTSMLELSAMSREAMERMRDTVWAIDARKDKYENLIDRMRDFAEKTLERKNITHEFITRDIDGKKFINPEVRQNIYLIFKEAITNVVKHSDGTHVRIEMVQDGNGLKMVIHDNGDQMASHNSDGLGMNNIHMRAEKIGGRCEVKFERGYKVVLTV